MSKIKVVFWSQSGNTEAMAKAIVEGVVAGGKDAEAIFVSDITPGDLKDDNVFALGCPAMGAEVLEEMEMEPFVEALESMVNGKTILLFGSYGWGDGEWMRDWVDRMSAAGAKVMNGEGLMCHEVPDDAGIEECINWGKQMATL
ncbi:MAG: flavodoxin [Lachnospiraceae bacterium]|nr:flavodoxin [Lachnospiraceae bacterium]